MLREERKRKLSLLVIVLRGIVFLSLVAVLVNAIVVNNKIDFIFNFIPGLFLGLFLFLLGLAKKGFLFTPLLVLISILSLIAYYLGICFGVVISYFWLLLILTIILAGVLFTPMFTLFLLGTHILLALILTFLQITNRIGCTQWTTEPTWGSTLVKSVILGVIGLVSWLSNREIEKALRLAKESEFSLKRERDNLEFEVEKRTTELKKVQLERMVNLYKFADFGRLTAGMFHDISNPLTQVSLSLSNIELQTKNKISFELNKLEPTIRRAINGTKQMQRMIVSVRKQVQQQETNSNYKPWMEIQTVIENFDYRAKVMNVQISNICKKEICTFGNPIRFYQLVSNLIANALDSYYEIKREENRKIIIKLDVDNGDIVLTVKDFGCGIDEEIRRKIFDPLFTTKNFERGTGIGLYISKMIVEKEFGGKIEVESKLNKGTLFTIKFPIKTKPDEKKYKPSN